MEQYYGMTAEMYQAVTALVDDRMKGILVTRQDFDRLAEAQIRTGDRLDRVEAALDRLAEAQVRSEERLDRVEATLDRLAEAQARSEERLDRVEATLDRLAEAQARTEERLNQLAEAQARTEERLNQLAEAQARSEERLNRVEAALDRLAEAQARTEEQLQDLVQVVGGMQITLGAVKGRQLEFTYQQKAGAYFGSLLRGLRVLSPIEIEDDLEAHLSTEEFEDLLRLDLLVSGRPRHVADAPQVWLAVEVSAVVDRHDVERARQRAAALRRAGYRAIPTVAGERATAGAEEEVRLHKTLLLQDGRALFWEEALEEALTL